MPPSVSHHVPAVVPKLESHTSLLRKKNVTDKVKYTRKSKSLVTARNR